MNEKKTKKNIAKAKGYFCSNDFWQYETTNQAPRKCQIHICLVILMTLNVNKWDLKIQ